jgi:hypothetical protein
MTLRSRLLDRSKVFLLIAAATAAAATASPAGATDEAAQNYLHSLINPDITASVDVRPIPPANPAQARLHVMVSHARAARALFGEARSAMERGSMLNEGAPKASILAVDTAMKNMRLHLDILAGMAKSRTADAVKKANAQAQAWYEAGMKVIRPSAEGVLELPSSVSLQAKADAAAASLEQVIEDTVTALARPARQVRTKRRIRPATAARPAANPAWAAFPGLQSGAH